MNGRCMLTFLIGFTIGVITVVAGALALSGALPSLNLTLNTTLPGTNKAGDTGALPWLFPGAYAKYNATGYSIFDQTQFQFTLSVRNVAGNSAELALVSEGFAWTFPVDLSSRDTIIVSITNGIAGEPIREYYTDTYDTVFGNRNVIVAKTDTKILILDEETLWPLAYIETNPDMQAVVIVEITEDTNIPLS